MPISSHHDAVFAGSLSKTWRNWRGAVRARALDNVTLRVPSGSSFGLLGPNGAGKTTFVKAIVGAVRPTSGIVTVFGHPAGSREAARLIGYVPGESALPAHLTPQQLLNLHAAMHGIAGADRRRRIPELLEEMGLATHAAARLHSLSRGMKQRAAIAAALLHRPRLLILDEPTDGLDPAARRMLLDLLQDWNRKRSVTLLVNSHLLDEVEELCDEVAILRSGRLVRHASVSALAALSSYVVSLRYVPAGLGPVLRARGFETEEDRDGALRVTVPSRDQLDWTLDQARSSGAVLDSLGPAGRVLEKVYLSESLLENQPEHAL